LSIFGFKKIDFKPGFPDKKSKKESIFLFRKLFYKKVKFTQILTKNFFQKRNFFLQFMEKNLKKRKT
jgi:hypothetical protein